MTTHVIAGDIGGTKTNLGLYRVDRQGGTVLLREESWPSRDFAGLEDVIARFRETSREEVAAAAFGIAGPVFGQRVVTTNLPWVVDAEMLSRSLGGARVRLMNDLESTAYGALFLPEHEIHVLQAGTPRDGNRAVIAAGTGLGQAFLLWDGQHYRPAATEGGHVDFAPRNEIEVELLDFLRRRFGRVSYERIVSGPGLHNVFTFLVEGQGRPVADAVRRGLAGEDPSAVIGEAAVAGTCATCAEAVDVFFRIYGAQAGNLALAVMGVGGIYVGGGIVAKLLPKMLESAFLEAFCDKAPYVDMMRSTPVRVILNPKTSLLGAARAAAELVA